MSIKTRHQPIREFEYETSIPVLPKFDEAQTIRLVCQIVTFTIIVAGLLALGCSTANDQTMAVKDHQPLQHSTARAQLPDGVYPVVTDGENGLNGNREYKIVELDVIPVKRTEPQKELDKIRIASRCLVRFQDTPSFDFTFENNECTAIGFQNTQQLKTYTRDHVGRQLAVVIDNRVISHHKIREALEVDQIRITCCTEGGGDHLHKYLKELKVAAGGQQ